MKNILDKQQTDINNLSPIEELDMAMHHATDAVLELIRNINALPVEQRQHITDMFDRVKDGKSKDV